MPEPFQRVVTGQTRTGQSSIASIEHRTPELIGSGDAAFDLVWTSHGLPVDHAEPHVDAKDDAGLTRKNGIVLRMVDILPGRASPMHRTNSLDFGIVVQGRLELELEDGSVTRLNAGDIIIQRGTSHLWRNPDTAKPCRVAFILIDAKPALVDGSALQEVHL